LEGAELMKFFSIALIYIAFFSLIGFAIWFTSTGWPLVALVLMPSLNYKDGPEKENNE
jgi:hypothetical protein